MLETTPASTNFCSVCAHEWRVEHEPVAAEPRAPSPEPRYRSIDDLIAKTGVRRDELAALAAIGALNAFGYDRRGALWQIERAARPSGELFVETAADEAPPANRQRSALRSMTTLERVKADYDGMGLTIGPHPMTMCRGRLAERGVQRAIDLPAGRSGRRVQVAGAVITRQRPGTAKGFVFLSLEDETGIANVIVTPGLFTRRRWMLVAEPVLLVEGILQIQDGVVSVRAMRVEPLPRLAHVVPSHDFG